MIASILAKCSFNVNVAVVLDVYILSTSDAPHGVLIDESSSTCDDGFTVPRTVKQTFIAELLTSLKRHFNKLSKQFIALITVSYNWTIFYN